MTVKALRRGSLSGRGQVGPSQIASDTFNRADGALGTADVGGVWTSLAGSWAILGNQAKITPAATNTQVIAMLPAGGTPGLIMVDITLSTVNAHAGIVLRATDINSYSAVQLQRTTAGTNQLRISKRIAGVSTYWVTTTGMGLLPGRGYTLAVVLTASAITAYVDGVPAGSYTFSTQDNTDLPGVRVGLRSWDNATSDEDGGSRWDNLSVTSSLSLVPRAPAPPIAPTATVVDETSATVTWTQAGNGSSPLTSYTVTSTGGNVFTGIDPTATSFNATGLTTDLQQTFTVTAINAVGSTDSVPSNAVTPTGGTGWVWPTRTNRGYLPTGVTLTPYGSGDITLSTPYQTLDSVLITGRIHITAVGVTIQRSLIKPAAPWTDANPIVLCDQPALLEDVEIDGNTMDQNAGADPALGWANYTARRCYIHNCGDGLRFNGANILVDDCWIGDLYHFGGQHNDTAQATEGCDNAIIQNCWLNNNTINGAGVWGVGVLLKADQGDIGSCIIDHNYFEYSLFGIELEDGRVISTCTDTGYYLRGLITITNNIFDKPTMQYGYAVEFDGIGAKTVDVSSIVYSQGNRYADGSMVDDANQLSGSDCLGRYPKVRKLPDMNVNPTAPSAPAAPVAVAGDSSAQLTWLPPSSDGGTSITGYSIQQYDSGVAGAITNVGAIPTAANITGLTNGHTYTFTVAATNSIGTSPYSSPSNAVVPAAAMIPGIPTGVVGSPGDGQVTVTWTAPSNGGSTITSYTVTPYIGAVAQPTTTVTGAPAPPIAVVTGLTNGTAYTFRVAATNAVGTGTPSAASSPVTPTASSATSYPTDPSQVGVPAGTVLTAWTGSTNFTTANQVIDAKQFTDITVNAPGVKFTRCLVRPTGPWNSSLIQIASGSATFEDCEFDGANLGQGQGLIGWNNFTLRRCWVHGGDDGVRPQTYCLIEDCYIGPQWYRPGLSHNDAVQVTGPAHDITVRRTNVHGLYQNETSALFIKADQGPITGPMLFDKCYFYGGNYYVAIQNAGYTVTGPLTFTNNVFAKGTCGIAGGSNNDIEAGQPLLGSGNVYDDGTHPVNGMPY